MPQVDTERSTFAGTHPLGPFAVVVLTRCASRGSTQYLHAALVVDGEGKNCFAVTAESTSYSEPPSLFVYPGGRAPAGAPGGALAAGASARGKGRPILLGDSWDYQELETFKACAFQIIQDHFPEGRLPLPSAPSGPLAPPAPSQSRPLDRAAVHSRVECWLKQAGLFYEPTPEGDFWLRFGTVLVKIQVWDWNQNRVVMLTAPVARRCRRLSPELGLYLLERNAELLFGRFSVHKQAQAVAFEHALLGDHLDAVELHVALALVSRTAQEHERQIAQLAAGERIVGDVAG
jgi:hypothetical protein